MKVVINSDYGGFSLSDNAVRRLFELKNWKCVEEKTKYDMTLFYKDNISEDSYFDEHMLERDDPDLVKVVEELGDKANGNFSCLKIVEIPDDLSHRWHICDYDGREHVAEDHRTWC